MVSESVQLQWGLRRRRSPAKHGAVEQPRCYSMPCSPPQRAEEDACGRRQKRARRRPRVLASEAPADDACVAAAGPTRLALLVKEPWVTLLCRGEKTWELRGSRTHKRGRVALVASRTGGWVVGGATLVACHGPLSPAQLAATEALHRVPQGASPGRYAQTYAWEFAAPVELAAPVRYRHPAGAVIWVHLDTPVAV